VLMTMPDGKGFELSSVRAPELPDQPQSGTGGC
jgi:hypothetical protein